MNAVQIIKVHTKLWNKKSTSYQSLRVGNMKFITQNLSKSSKHTDWVKGDPLHRKLTWIFQSGEYVGYVREYVSKGHVVIEIHKMHPDRMVWRQEAA